MPLTDVVRPLDLSVTKQLCWNKGHYFDYVFLLSNSLLSSMFFVYIELHTYRTIGLLKFILPNSFPLKKTAEPGEVASISITKQRSPVFADAK